jgi:hypothetical protein
MIAYLKDFLTLISKSTKNGFLFLKDIVLNLFSRFDEFLGDYFQKYLVKERPDITERLLTFYLTRVSWDHDFEEFPFALFDYYSLKLKDSANWFVLVYSHVFWFLLHYFTTVDVYSRISLFRWNLARIPKTLRPTLIDYYFERSHELQYKSGVLNTEHSRFFIVKRYLKFHKVPLIILDSVFSSFALFFDFLFTFILEAPVNFYHFWIKPTVSAIRLFLERASASLQRRFHNKVVIYANTVLKKNFDSARIYHDDLINNAINYYSFVLIRFWLEIFLISLYRILLGFFNFIHFILLELLLKLVPILGRFNIYDSIVSELVDFAHTRNKFKFLKQFVFEFTPIYVEIFIRRLFFNIRSFFNWLIYSVIYYFSFIRRPILTLRLLYAILYPEYLRSRSFFRAFLYLLAVFLFFSLFYFYGISILLAYWPKDIYEIVESSVAYSSPFPLNTDFEGLLDSTTWYDKKAPPRILYEFSTEDSSTSARIKLNFFEKLLVFCFWIAALGSVQSVIFLSDDRVKKEQISEVSSLESWTDLLEDDMEGGTEDEDGEFYDEDDYFEPTVIKYYPEFPDLWTFLFGDLPKPWSLIFSQDFAEEPSVFNSIKEFRKFIFETFGLPTESGILLSSELSKIKLKRLTTETVRFVFDYWYEYYWPFFIIVFLCFCAVPFILFLRWKWSDFRLLSSNETTLVKDRLFRIFRVLGVNTTDVFNLVDPVLLKKLDSIGTSTFLSEIGGFDDKLNLDQLVLTEINYHNFYVFDDVMYSYFQNISPWTYNTWINYPEVTLSWHPSSLVRLNTRKTLSTASIPYLIMKQTSLYSPNRFNHVQNLLGLYNEEYWFDGSTPVSAIWYNNYYEGFTQTPSMSEDPVGSITSTVLWFTFPDQHRTIRQVYARNKSFSMEFFFNKMLESIAFHLLDETQVSHIGHDPLTGLPIWKKKRGTEPIKAFLKRFHTLHYNLLNQDEYFPLQQVPLRDLNVDVEYTSPFAHDYNVNTSSFVEPLIAPDTRHMTQIAAILEFNDFVSLPVPILHPSQKKKLRSRKESKTKKYTNPIYKFYRKRYAFTSPDYRRALGINFRNVPEFLGGSTALENIRAASYTEYVESATQWRYPVKFTVGRRWLLRPPAAVFLNGYVHFFDNFGYFRNFRKASIPPRVSEFWGPFKDLSYTDELFGNHYFELAVPFSINVSRSRNAWEWLLEAYKDNGVTGLIGEFERVLEYLENYEIVKVPNLEEVWNIMYHLAPNNNEPISPSFKDFLTLLDYSFSPKVNIVDDLTYKTGLRRFLNLKFNLFGWRQGFLEKSKARTKVRPIVRFLIEKTRQETTSANYRAPVVKPFTQVEEINLVEYLQVRSGIFATYRHLRTLDPWWFVNQGILPWFFRPIKFPSVKNFNYTLELYARVSMNIEEDNSIRSALMDRVVLFNPYAHAWTYEAGYIKSQFFDFLARSDSPSLPQPYLDEFYKYFNTSQFPNSIISKDLVSNATLSLDLLDGEIESHVTTLFFDPAVNGDLSFVDDISSLLYALDFSLYYDNLKLRQGLPDNFRYLKNRVLGERAEPTVSTTMNSRTEESLVLHTLPLLFGFTRNQSFPAFIIFIVVGALCFGFKVELHHWTTHLDWFFWKAISKVQIETLPWYETISQGWFLDKRAWLVLSMALCELSLLPFFIRNLLDIGFASVKRFSLIFWKEKVYYTKKANDREVSTFISPYNPLIYYVNQYLWSLIKPQIRKRAGFVGDFSALLTYFNGKNLKKKFFRNYIEKEPRSTFNAVSDEVGPMSMSDQGFFVKSSSVPAMIEGKITRYLTTFPAGSRFVEPPPQWTFNYQFNDGYLKWAKNLYRKDKSALEILQMLTVTNSRVVKPLQVDQFENFYMYGWHLGIKHMWLDVYRQSIEIIWRRWRNHVFRETFSMENIINKQYPVDQPPRRNLLDHSFWEEMDIYADKYRQDFLSGRPLAEYVGIEKRRLKEDRRALRKQKRELILFFYKLRLSVLNDPIASQYVADYDNFLKQYFNKLKISEDDVD